MGKRRDDERKIVGIEEKDTGTEKNILGKRSREHKGNEGEEREREWDI